MFANRIFYQNLVKNENYHVTPLNLEMGLPLAKYIWLKWVNSRAKLLKAIIESLVRMVASLVI